MKYIFLILGLSCGLIQAQQSDNVTAVLSCLKAQQNAWNKASIDDFMSHYWNHDSLRFVSGSNMSMGWTTARDNYKKHYSSPEAMGQLRFTIVYAECLNDTTCMLSGTWAIARAKPVGGRFTLLWKKIQGHWKIVYDHTS